MTVTRITEAERQQIIRTRPNHGAEPTKFNRDANRAVFRMIKTRYGIPTNQKIKIEIDAALNPDFLVIKDKLTGQPISTLHGRTATPVNAPAQPAWATPAKAVEVAKLASAYDNAKVPAASPAAASVIAPRLRVGSINLDDAVQLLRAEGDACDSFAQSTEAVTGTVMIKDGRLYFVA